MLNCRYCNYEHNVSARFAGNRIWCPNCGNWLMLAFRQGREAYFVKVDSPATYPRGKRRR
jgi:hypothetical protein